MFGFLLAGSRACESLLNLGAGISKSDRSMALSDKEAVAQSEVDAFMENCAKRWQTREGTYQLKRRRLKPDVRDSPEYPGADIDMADI